MRKRGKLFTTLFVILVVLAGLRLALPWVLEYAINQQLAGMDIYTGRVEDVDLSLWRGAYRVDGVVIQKRQGKDLEPFFTGESIELSVEWESLFKGALVAEIILRQPQMNLVEAAEKDRAQTGEEIDWDERLEALFPFRFNTIRVENGTVRFRTPGIARKDALTASDLNGEVHNLTNVTRSDAPRFASFHFSSQVFNAPLQLQGKVDPGAEQPTFDLNLTLKKVKLTALNPWLREYLNADAQAGRFALYAEVAGAGGAFPGYAKPFLEEVDMYTAGESSKGLLQRAWEGTLDLAAEVFEDQPSEEIASRIPLRGTIENPEAGVFTAVINILRNAFAESFTRSLEGSVSLPEGE